MIFENKQKALWRTRRNGQNEWIKLSRQEAALPFVQIKMSDFFKTENMFLHISKFYTFMPTFLLRLFLFCFMEKYILIKAWRNEWMNECRLHSKLVFTDKTNFTQTCADCTKLFSRLFPDFHTKFQTFQGLENNISEFHISLLPILSRPVPALWTPVTLKLSSKKYYMTQIC